MNTYKFAIVGKIIQRVPFTCEVLADNKQEAGDIALELYTQMLDENYTYLGAEIEDIECLSSTPMIRAGADEVSDSNNIQDWVFDGRTFEYRCPDCDSSSEIRTNYCPHCGRVRRA